MYIIEVRIQTIRPIALQAPHIQRPTKYIPICSRRSDVYVPLVDVYIQLVGAPTIRAHSIVAAGINVRVCEGGGGFAEVESFIVGGDVTVGDEGGGVVEAEGIVGGEGIYAVYVYVVGPEGHKPHE